MIPVYTCDDIKSALASDELKLFFQPKVCLLRGKVLGAEALVRWCRKDGTVIGPDNFISIAEAGGLLHSITIEMLSQAVKTINDMAEDFPNLSLSMNVTPYDLASHHISDTISEHLKQGRIRACDLQVEITESEVMTRFDDVRDDIVRLTELGIDVLMDDFGVGYSSIDRLSQLPFSSLKLDKGVVSRMSSSQQNLDVVKSAISMARELRMTSVAEGVESEGTYNFLVANGCEQAQGFWISKPLDYENYLQFLSEGATYQGSQIGCVHQALLNIVQFRKSLVDAMFCRAVATEPTSELVVSPEMRKFAEDSRFGIWYYGSGQVLSEVTQFQELEAPFKSMLDHARELLQCLNDGCVRETRHKHLELVDADITELVSRLHSLERYLLSNSQSNGLSNGLSN